MNIESLEQQEVKRVRELQITNQRVLFCYALLGMVLTISYCIEVIKGNRTIPYVLLFSLLLWLPQIISMYIYRKDDEASLIKHVVVIGYGIFYTFALMTTTSKISFVFVLPMMTAITLYMDMKFCLRVGSAAIVVNIVHFVWKWTQNEVTISDFEIEIACIVLVTIFMTLAARTINEIFESKMSQIRCEKDRQALVLEQIVSVTDNISRKIDDINEEAKSMEQTSNLQEIATEEMATGTIEVSNRLQDQTNMTNNINQLTEQTNELVDEILERFRSTRENTATGSDSMEQLIKASYESRKSVDTVGGSVTELSNKILEVEGILNMIDGITKQTSLLSLNASIEAARAGEAGRGFSVVASNIQQLAEQTKDATQDIQHIFAELSELNENAVTALSELKQTNLKQESLIEQSKQDFNVIEHDIITMTDNVDQQSSHMQKVKNSNVQICDNIEEISTHAENLTKNAEDTREVTKENLGRIHTINGLLDQVLAEVSRLEEVQLES